MNTWAAPGVRCVCISDDFGHVSCDCGCGGELPVRQPMLNELLTIRSVEIC